MNDAYKLGAAHALVQMGLVKEAAMPGVGVWNKLTKAWDAAGTGLKAWSKGTGAAANATADAAAAAPTKTWGQWAKDKLTSTKDSIIGSDDAIGNIWNESWYLKPFNTGVKETGTWGNKLTQNLFPKEMAEAIAKKDYKGLGKAALGEVVPFYNGDLMQGSMLTMGYGMAGKGLYDAYTTPGTSNADKADAIGNAGLELGTNVLAGTSNFTVGNRLRSIGSRFSRAVGSTFDSPTPPSTNTTNIGSGN